MQAYDVLEPESMMKRVRGNRTLLFKVITMFRNNLPQMLEQIEQALVQKDAHGLEESAHKLKGAISNFTQKSPFQAALALEKMGHCGDFAMAPQTFDDLKQEVGVLQTALTAYATVEV